MERLITDEHGRKLLVRFISQHRLPFVCSVVAGKPRSLHQNKLQRMWMNEIAEQIDGMTAEEVRGYCKLMFGVPILRAESERFRERYDTILKPLTYESKMALMMEPLDLPVTRIMTTKQKTEYLDALYRHFTEKGVKLTVPMEPPR